MFKIDYEFQSQIPPLTDEEFKQLEDNIVSDGVIINPLIVWNGILVDGHNRCRILEKYPNIKYTVYEKSFCDRYAVLAWICKNQLGRRNLTNEQKKYLIGKQYEAEKHSIGGQIGNNNAKRSGHFVHFVSDEKTSERIARENKTNERYVRRAEQFAKGIDAAEEIEQGIRQKILSGDIKVSDLEILDIKNAELDVRKILVGKLGQKKTKKINMKEARKQTAIIKQISEKMEQPDLNFSKDDAIIELKDALNSLFFRWNNCIDIYKEYKQLYQDELNSLAKECIAYMEQIQSN